MGGPFNWPWLRSGCCEKLVVQYCHLATRRRITSPGPDGSGGATSAIFIFFEIQLRDAPWAWKQSAPKQKMAKNDQTGNTSPNGKSGKEGIGILCKNVRNGGPTDVPNPSKMSSVIYSSGRGRGRSTCYGLQPEGVMYCPFVRNRQTSTWSEVYIESTVGSPYGSTGSVSCPP